MLEINKLYSGYNGIDIIKDINVNINKGENLCIIGPNGCGKSTLLKTIANIIDYRGNIKIDNLEVSSLKRKELAKKIGLMSQISQIYFPYSVYDAVSIGRYAYNDNLFGISKKDKDIILDCIDKVGLIDYKDKMINELSGGQLQRVFLARVFAQDPVSKKDKDIILDCIDKVGLIDYKDKMINELSGGQLQRVFLARVFAQDPDIILLDEPTNHLDLKHQIELLENLNKWTKENNKIVIAVLHDLNLVQYIADNVLLLSNGMLIKYGKVDEVLNNDVLKQVYGLDIKEFMINILKKWEQN